MADKSRQMPVELSKARKKGQKLSRHVILLSAFSNSGRGGRLRPLFSWRLRPCLDFVSQQRRKL